MSQHTYLFRRNAVYYFRARVPSSLVHKIRKSELKFSLRTKNYGVAKMRLAYINLCLQKVFRHMVARPKTNVNLVAQVVSKFLNHLDFFEGVERSISALSAEVKAGPYEGIETRDAEERKLVNAIANSDFSEIDADVYEHAGYWVLPENSRISEGIDDSEFINYFEDDTFEHFLLRNAFLRARLETIRKEKARDIADFSYTAQDPLFQEASLENIQRVLMRDYGKFESIFHDEFDEDDENLSDEATTLSDTVTYGSSEFDAQGLTTRNSTGPKISEVFEGWIHFNDPAQKTIKDYRTQLRRFIEIFGDIPVDTVTVEDVRHFRDVVSQLPTRMTSKQASMNIVQLVETLKGDTEIKRVSPRTVKDKALAAISSILGHAKREALISQNVASGISVKKIKGENPKKPRTFFKGEHLQAIVNSGIFTQGSRPEGGKGEAAIWAPLISMFSGARVAEILGLRVDEICIEEGVEYFFIKYNAFRRMKTGSSVRKIPIHSQLKELGFMEYVARQRKLKHVLLFNRLPTDKADITKAWDQWWGRYLRNKIGLLDDKLVFHSFRHTFKRRLQNCTTTDPRIIDALMGHASGSVAEGYGQDEDSIGYDLKVLHAEIEKLRYDDVDFSNVMKPSYL